MTAVTELALPSFDHTDPDLRGDRYRAAMAAITGHDGWLVACPFGFIVLDREAGEFFLRSRDAVFPGLRIAELFGITGGPLRREIEANIINRGGADHARLRGLVGPAFTPRAVARFRPAMRRRAIGLVEAALASGEVDFVAAVARPYPAEVIADVMGAPVTDAPRLHHWSSWIQRQFDPVSLTGEREAIEHEVRTLYAYLDELIAARRTRPSDDLISRLIAAESDGDRLSGSELVDLALNVLVGGVDTSQSQLAHAVRLLADDPRQWAALRADPAARAGDAVEEALRFEPITPFTARMTTAEVEFRGVRFPPDTVVLVSAWHANRRGGETDRFDITAGRPDLRLLTFGAGIHYCLGANLARAEMEEALIALAERAARITPSGEPSYGTPSGVYALDSLPLSLSAA